LIIGVSPLGIATIGCKTDGPAAKVVREYWSQENCADRVKFVLSPEANRAAMVEHYKDTKTCKKKLDSIDDSDCASATTPGSYCSVTADERQYCLKRVDNGFVIDWRCSVGYNPMSIVTFRSVRPRTPHLFRAHAKLGSYYNYAYQDAERTHYSVELWIDSVRIHGYVYKTDADGVRLFDALKDGRSHPILVQLQYPPGAADADVVAIDMFWAPNWREHAVEIEGQ